MKSSFRTEANTLRAKTLKTSACTNSILVKRQTISFLKATRTLSNQSVGLKMTLALLLVGGILAFTSGSSTRTSSWTTPVTPVSKLKLGSQSGSTRSKTIPSTVSQSTDLSRTCLTPQTSTSRSQLCTQPVQTNRSGR